MSIDKKQTQSQTIKLGSSDSSEVPEQLIRKLSDLLKATDLSEIELELENIKIRVKAKESVVNVTPQAYFSSPAQPAAAPLTAGAPASGGRAESATDLHIVRSPFVGTFYRAPSPTASVFVEVNQNVTKNQ